MTPKPRKPGQTGGDNNRTNRANHAAARVNQKAAKSDWWSCGVVILGVGTTAVLQGSYVAYSLFSLAV